MTGQGKQTTPPQGVPPGKLEESEFRANLTRLANDAKKNDARSFITAVLLYTMLRGEGDEFVKLAGQSMAFEQSNQFRAKNDIPMLIRLAFNCIRSFSLRHLYVYVYNCCGSPVV
jgi:hypothetical protein